MMVPGFNKFLDRTLSKVISDSSATFLLYEAIVVVFVIFSLSDQLIDNVFPLSCNVVNFENETIFSAPSISSNSTNACDWFF